MTILELRHQSTGRGPGPAFQIPPNHRFFHRYKTAIHVEDDVTTGQGQYLPGQELGVRDMRLDFGIPLPIKWPDDLVSVWSGTATLQQETESWKNGRFMWDISA
jgi:hypothetical protein